MTGPKRSVAAVAILAAVASISACGSKGTSVAAPSLPVVLAAAPQASSADPMKIGVIYTPGTRFEGSTTNGLGEGAAVAAFRLSRGGTPVELVAESDDGTSAGTTNAIKTLAGAGVVGIIDLSLGSHVSSAVGAAASANLALLFPYEDGSDLSAVAGNVWLTGPAAGQEATAVAHAATGPVALISSPDHPVPAAVTAQLGKVTAFTYAPDGGVPQRLRRDIGTFGSIVIWDTPESTAIFEGQLQSLGEPATVFASGRVVEPAFGEKLSGLSKGGSATTFTQVLAPGVKTSDFSTTDGTQGFLVALRALANDPDARDLSDSISFLKAGGAAADTRSYNAVIALANAAGHAGSTDPAAVATALRGLTLTVSDGVVGPELDFTHSPDTLADADVTLLKAASQPTGLRPGAGLNLSWYPAEGQ